MNEHSSSTELPLSHIPEVMALRDRRHPCFQEIRAKGVDDVRVSNVINGGLIGPKPAMAHRSGPVSTLNGTMKIEYPGSRPSEAFEELADERVEMMTRLAAEKS